MFLNKIPSNGECLINNGYTITGLLTACISELIAYQGDISHHMTSSDSEQEKTACTLYDEFRLTSKRYKKAQNMLLFHIDFTCDLNSLYILNTKISLVNENKSIVYYFLPALVLYCSDVSHDKNVSVVKHGLPIIRPCEHVLAKITHMETMDKLYMKHIYFVITIPVAS